jgi:hypothetical protein
VENCESRVPLVFYKVTRQTRKLLVSV